MSREEKSKLVNPYDLTSVKRERTSNQPNPEPKDVNPYSLSGKDRIRGGSTQK
jgi:hypothetical protein